MFKKVLFTVAAVLLATPVFATPVTYLFQSDNYTQLSYASSGPGLPGGYQNLGPYGVTGGAAIAFTLSAALDPNSTVRWSGSLANGLPPEVLSYSANTGLHSFSTAEDISLRLTTDATGAINAWDIFFHSRALADDTTLWSRADGGQIVTDVQYQNEYSMPTSATGRGPAIGGEQSRASAFGGTWSILNPQAQTTLAALSPAPTPVGGTGTLLLSGLGLMGLWRWRRRSAA
jgi:hypothetical protein